MTRTPTIAGLIFAFAAVLPLPAAAVGAEEPRPASAPVRPPSREERLWQRVVGLMQATPATQPFGQWFVAADHQRQRLCDVLRLYLTLYPGGAHRDDAIRLELVNLFELGTLRGGQLDPLRERVNALLAAPPSEFAECEAAYWQIICDRAASPRAASRPTSRPADEPFGPVDDNQRTAYEAYLAKYPRSHYAPRLAALLFEDALQRGDRGAMQAAVAHLEEYFPAHAGTAEVRGAWQRESGVGQPLRARLRLLTGKDVDTADYAGRPLLIVVWAGYDEVARQRVAEIERHRRVHPDVQVLGVSLDEGAEATRAAADTLAIDWPQSNDGLGWGGEFVRAWGVRRIPWVFVLDRAGRLLGSTDGDGWKKWADQALADGPASRRAGGSD